MSRADAGLGPAALPRSPGAEVDKRPVIMIVEAGDVRFSSAKRLASAVGEGSVAIRFVHDYLSSPISVFRPAAETARERAHEPPPAQP